MTKLPPVPPAYQRVAKQLREAILQNRYPEGQRLPTEGELAAEYGLGRQTIRRVFQDLTAEGLVYRVRRRGTFAYPVTRPLGGSFGHLDDLAGWTAADETEILAPLLPCRDDKLADDVLQLGGAVPSGLDIRRIRGRRVLYSATLRFPPAVTEVLETEAALTRPGHRGRFTVISLIDRHLGGGITNMTEAIQAVAAAEEPARRLEIPQCTPVSRVERVYFDRVGRPVEFARTWYHPEHLLVRSRLRR